MAKIARKLQKIFGNTGGVGEFGQFGSDAAASPTTSKDPDIIQGLSQFEQGWYSATANANEPPRIQDMNGLQFLYAYQLKYLFQSGIPEWIATEDYYVDASVVNYTGDIYLALLDNTGSQPDITPLDWVKIIPKAGSISQADGDARYLQQSNNLSDVTNAITSRTNLDVYSKAESDALFNLSINEITANYTILDADGYDVIEYDSRLGALNATLPLAANNTGRVIKFIQKYKGGRSTVVGTIGGYTNIFLDEENSSLTCYSNGTTWEIINLNNTIDPGWINSSDYSNRETGTQELDYFTLVGSFTIGATVTGGTSGATGIIMSDNGSTLKLRNVTAGGIFTNNEALTDNATGVTALANEPSGFNKNLDSDFFHNLNVPITDLIIEYFISMDGTDNNSFKIDFDSVLVGSGTHYGRTFYQVDSNNFTPQTAASGFLRIDAAGITQTINTEDWYYKVRIKQVI